MVVNDAVSVTIRKTRWDAEVEIVKQDGSKESIFFSADSGLTDGSALYMAESKEEWIEDQERRF